MAEPLPFVLSRLFHDWARQLTEWERLVTGPSFTPEDTRRYLERTEPCYQDCPGWRVSWPDEGMPKLERCDECCFQLPDIIRPYDDDIALLPEARRELLKATIEAEDCGPEWDKYASD